tara:strand:- start:7582 stop:7830 length:249 start_codon:yes stop_codon:yes gene_type:complete
MVNLVWTFLVITYWVEGERLSTSILFPSEQQCQSVMDRGLFEEMYFELVDTYGKKIIMSCKPTSIFSKEIVKPKPRPKDHEG